MNKKLIGAAGLLTAGLLAGSFMSIAGANAADTPSTPSSSSSSAPVPPSFKAHAPEEAVTGDLATTLSDLAKAKVPGATVDRVEKDSDGVATYEVHMTKTDGTHVKVNFDANNAITSVDTQPAGGPGAFGKGGDRTPPAEVTGTIATTLGDLAKTKVAGATVDHIFKDTRNGAAYVVLMTKTDGTKVAVHFDANNAILSVDTPPAGGPKGFGGKGHGPRGGDHDGDRDGTNGGAWTPPTTTTP
ncbi:PepSY domain-containing protein [Rhodoluna sp.]|uniref:PepSY domain-containing protein n=1 Tax=Rhodoluna sp. TaxID=1969481 RepID=UPI0025E03005|nr:PepSY domain-containing protein [Rhodoluna sp.]